MSANYFLEQYQQLSRIDCRKFKETCLAHFGWTESTFYNKLSTGNLRPNEERDLAKIIAPYIHY